MNIEQAMSITSQILGKQKIWKGMAIAHSIFTLEEDCLMFFSAFDLSFTVIPLKVAIGLEKNDFWAFKKK